MKLQAVLFALLRATVSPVMLQYQQHLYQLRPQELDYFASLVMTEKGDMWFVLLAPCIDLIDCADIRHRGRFKAAWRSMVWCGIDA